jgi:sugar phosphate isomerase/epimerase
MNIGLQLYTIKDHLTNFEESLKKVSTIGYHGIELHKTFAEEQLVFQNVIGVMFDFNILKTHLANSIDYCQKVSCSTIIIPNLNDHSQDTLNDLVRLDKSCKEQDITLLYHIHGDEFNDRFIYCLLNETKVNLELDTYWVKYAGVDPVQFLKEYGERCPYIHLKDMLSIDKETEVGNGILDMLNIINIGKNYGCKWFVVEQEQFDKDVFESIKISFDNVSYFDSFATKE